MKWQNGDLNGSKSRNADLINSIGLLLAGSSNDFKVGKADRSQIAKALLQGVIPVAVALLEQLKATRTEAIEKFKEDLETIHAEATLRVAGVDPMIRLLEKMIAVQGGDDAPIVDLSDEDDNYNLHNA